jgi:uroporphyrinogen-III decarboxylase
MGTDAVLAGNLDPVRTIRNGTPESVTEAVAQCHQQAGQPYIIAAGCEIPRGTPEPNLWALTRYAHATGEE